MKILFRLLLVSCFGISQHSALAQPAERTRTVINRVLTGNVFNAITNEPMPAASVYLHEARVGAITNDSGFYRIQNLPGGRLLVEVSHLGFSTITEVIEVSEQMQKDFYLEPEIVENQGVTVTGVASATQIKKAPIPVSIVRKEQLMKGASTNLIDALSKIPGVSQVSTGPAISKPSIRGLGYNRVVVVNDGVRQEGQQWGDEHGIEIDEYSVTKAEVLKGPASIMYGSDALAGVVNFVSVIAAPQGTIRGNLLTNYQTNNRLRSMHADFGGNYNGFVWGVNGTYKLASDYRNRYDGYVFNSKFREKNFGGYAGFNKRWGFAHLLLSSFDQTPGLVEGERDDVTGQFLKPVNNNGTAEEEIALKEDFRSTNPFIPKQRIRHLKLTSDNSFNLAANRLVLNLGYQRNLRQEFGDVVNPGIPELEFNLQTFNYNVQLHFSERNHWKTSIGVNGMRQQNDIAGEEQLIPEYSLFDIGVFAYARKTIDKVTLSGGLRFDNRSIDSRQFASGSEIKFQAFQRNYANVSASAGLSYEASKDVTLKFNIARGFRAPSIPELASNGAHEGTNRFEYGEQSLRSERSLQLDAGIDFNSEHVSLAANIFYNRVNDFIFYRKLNSVAGGDSIIDDGGEQFFAFRFSQNDANLYGLELNLDIHPHPLDWLHFENSFSYTRGKLVEAQDGSRNLPAIPGARLINELRGDFLRKGKSVKNLYLNIELDNSFAQNHAFTGYNTETKTGGYSLLNIGLGGDIANQGKTIFSLYFSANNLADVAYQSHLNRLKYAPQNLATGRMGVFNMGRNFSIKLNVPLIFHTRTTGKLAS